MLFESSYGRGYVFAALLAAPDLMSRALSDLTPEEADRRPDPERFTIREVIAHLADWDPIFLYRMRRMCEDENPTLPGYEPDDLARDHDYAHSNVEDQFAKWQQGRHEMVDFLESLSPGQFQRTAERPEIGQITLQEQTLMIPLHDTYHLIQVHRTRERK
jgi:uncharacterized damage-inducible protein DinB